MGSLAFEPFFWRCGLLATIARHLLVEKRDQFGELETVSDKEIKVTDKRMFTADGELREEFRDLENQQPGQPMPVQEKEEAPEEVEPERSRRVESVGSPKGVGAPSFFDLVSVLAEPVALYLGDATLPDGKSLENLDMAKLHIDLLDLLRQKTVGNISSEELRILDDLLYRLRLRFVEKRG